MFDFLKGSVDQTAATGSSAAATGAAAATGKAEEKTGEADLSDEAQKVADAANAAAAKGTDFLQGLSSDLSLKDTIIRVSDNWMMFFKGYFVLNAVSLAIGILFCIGTKKHCCGSCANCLNCLLGIALLVFLILGLVSRFARTGRICAGDLRTADSPSAEFGSAYFPNSGKWLKVILAVQVAMFLLGCFAACCCFKRKNPAKWGNDSD